MGAPSKATEAFIAPKGQTTSSPLLGSTWEAGWFDKESWRDVDASFRFEDEADAVKVTVNADQDASTFYEPRIPMADQPTQNSSKTPLMLFPSQKQPQETTDQWAKRMTAQVLSSIEAQSAKAPQELQELTPEDKEFLDKVGDTIRQEMIGSFSGNPSPDDPQPSSSKTSDKPKPSTSGLGLGLTPTSEASPTPESP